MNICRTAFKKVFKKDIFDDIIPFEDLPELTDIEKKYCSLFNLEEITLMRYKYDAILKSPEEKKAWESFFEKAINKRETGICRIIFSKQYYKSADEWSRFDNVTKKGNITEPGLSMLADLSSDELSISLDFLENIYMVKTKPLIRHTHNPRYRKYKAYLERCYG